MSAPATQAPIDRELCPKSARLWAMAVCNGVMDGTVRPAYGDTAVTTLERSGLWDLASSVRSAVAMRRGLLAVTS